MMLELYELLKLADSTSLAVARGAYISNMHKIEEGRNLMDGQVDFSTM